MRHWDARFRFNIAFWGGQGGQQKKREKQKKDRLEGASCSPTGSLELEAGAELGGVGVPQGWEARNSRDKQEWDEPLITPLPTQLWTKLPQLTLT